MVSPLPQLSVLHYLIDTTVDDSDTFDLIHLNRHSAAECLDDVSVLDTVQELQRASPSSYRLPAN